MRLPSLAVSRQDGNVGVNGMSPKGNDSSYEPSEVREPHGLAAPLHAPTAIDAAPLPVPPAVHGSLSLQKLQPQAMQEVVPTISP